MGELRILAPEELVSEIRRKLQVKPRSLTWHDYKIAPDPVEPAAYTLVVGAGFSSGVVPLTGQLMQETIGDYYIPDQDGAFGRRPPKALRKHSASFWIEFNQACREARLPVVELDRQHLPAEPGKAYQTLFAYEGANALFKKKEARPKRKSFHDRLLEQRGLTVNRPPDKDPKDGKRFVKGFLRYVLSPGSEHGYGSTGRIELNDAHIHLAAMLEAQQCGHQWSGAAFCRTIFTTNFDTLLQVALQRVHLIYMITDRPERGLDSSDFPEEEEAIHLVYTHGSILRHNPASAVHELTGLSKKNVLVLRDFLQQRDVITIGYGGWEDGLMAALRLCDASRHKLYWCDIQPKPAERIGKFLESKGEGAAYVLLNKDGAGGLMRMLSEGLISKRG